MTMSSFVSLLVLLNALPAAFAAPITKQTTGTDLTAGASWVNGVAPASGDVATWDTGSLGAGLTLNSGAPSWLGIKVNAGATDPIAIGSGGTLTLGTSGIDLSASAINATISSGLTLGAGNQLWNLKAGSSRTLTVNGTFTRNIGSTLMITTNATSGIGTVTFSPTLVNSLVPWAIMTNSGTAANNSALGYTYATTSGGNVVAYTAATAETTASAWGGLASGGSGTGNYDLNYTTSSLTGLNRNVNTFRYIAAGVIQNGNTATVLLNANTILNAGSGTFTIGGSGTAIGVAPSSSANELVLVAANAGITFGSSSFITNNGASAAAVTVAGPNTVTFSGPNTYTGNLSVNSGTCAAGLGLGDPGVATSQGSALGNIGTAVSRSIIVNNGGTLSLTAGNTLGTGASANTLSAVTLVVNSGGVFQSGANAAGAGWWNKIGAVNLNGGTIHVGSGANNGAFQGLALIGTVTVGGSSASTIDNFGSSDTAYNAIHLGQNATANQSITFNVADVTGNPNTDLTIAAKLINTSSTLTASGLTKTGAGTMTLTGVNTYTGNTTISNGVLALSGSGSLASPNIVLSGGTFDVSAITYTLLAGQTLSGNGVVTGTVATASSSAITPGIIGGAGTNTFKNALNMGAGGSAVFDLNTTYNSGNDQVVVSGNLTLSSSDAIHINALSGTSPLDQTADYVLFSVAGTTTMTTTPTLVWDGTTPANYLNYSLVKSGNNVVLRYTAATAPLVTSSSSVNPTSATRNQAVTVSAYVTKGSGNIVSVTVNLSQIGGSATAGLILDVADSSSPNFIYTNTFVVAASTTFGSKSLTVTATDDTTPTALTGGYVITPLTIIVNSATWDGLGSDNEWTTNPNWSGNAGPGLIGDSVTFSGTTGPTPDMNTNYSVTGVTFDGTAGNFTLSATNGSTLTNGSSGILNNSSSTETLNMPVVLGAAQTFLASSGNLTLNSNIVCGANLLTVDGGNNTTVGGSISGSGGLTKNGVGTLILSNANTFTGTVTLNVGEIVSANSIALSTAARVVIPANNSVTLAFQTDGGDSPIKIGMGSGSTVYNLVSDRATTGLGVNHPLSVLAANGLGGGTLNFTAGGNVTSGTASFSFDALGMGAGSAQTTILNPTTATVSITNVSKFNNTPAQTLQLDGTTTGNQIVGTIANGTATITITKANTSTWTLSGTNTFTGGVNINGGTLVAGSPNGALGASGTISFGGGTLQYGAGNNADYSARFSTAASQTYTIDENGNNVTYAAALISSGGSLTLADTAGGGSLTLSGTNTFSGGATVNSGKLMFSTTGSGASAITVNAGAVGVVLASAGGSWTNASDLNSSAGSELDVDFAAFVPSTNLAPMTINGNFNATTPITVRVKGLTANFIIGQTNPLVTWASSGLSVTNGLTLIMPTRLAGHLLISGNTLSIVVDSNTGPLSWNTGNGNWNTSTPNWVDATLASATYIDGSDGVVFDGASGALGNPVITIATVLSPTGVMVNSASHNYTFTGAGGLAGNGSLQVQNGTLTNATANTYTGGTTVSGGKLQISGSGTLGASSGALAVSGGTVDLNGTSQTAGAVTISSGSLQNGTLTNTSFAANNASALTLRASLAGSGGLTKTGNGTLTLTNQNAFTGSVFVKGGTLVMDTGSAINNGGSYSDVGQSGSDVGILTLKGTATFTNTQDFNLGDLDSSTGTLNIQDSAVLNINAFFIGSANATGSTASGTVNQTGGTIIENNAGIGTFAIGGRASTTGVGVYNMSGGTLTAAAGIRVGGTGTGTMNISGTAVVNANGGFNIARVTAGTSIGTLNLNGGTVNTLNFASSTGVNATNNFNGSMVLPTGNNATFMTGLTEANVRNGGAIFNTAGFNITIAQVLQHSDVLGDNAVDGGLTKNGIGTLTLTGADTYTGNTTVNGGTLEIAQATIATNSTVTVAGGGAQLQLDFTGVTNQVGAIVLNGFSQAAGVYNSNNIPAYITGGGSLIIQAIGPSGSSQLTNSVTGGGTTLSLSWGAGWKLQMQTNSLSTGLGTNWNYITDGTLTSTNITIDATKPTVFYRLVYP